MPRDRDHTRERSPISYDSSDTRRYRDRSDAPTKRKHRETSDDATLPGPVKKKVQLAVQNREKQNYPSVNELKRRIRDVKRLLSRGDLAADARIVQERALAGYKKDLEDETQRRARSQMIKKYHFVRFLGMFYSISMESKPGKLTKKKKKSRSQIGHQKPQPPRPPREGSRRLRTKRL